VPAFTMTAVPGVAWSRAYWMVLYGWALDPSFELLPEGDTQTFFVGVRPLNGTVNISFSPSRRDICGGFPSCTGPLHEVQQRYTSCPSRCGIAANSRRHGPLRNCSRVWIYFPKSPRERGAAQIFSLRGVNAAAGRRINNSAAICE
jgi:hypothetical protein